MAYALIAGLPVQYGLYVSIIPTIVACLGEAPLTSSPAQQQPYPWWCSPPWLVWPRWFSPLPELAFLLALIVGAIQIGMALARLGVFLNFVSHSVILGYTAGAAVLIGFKQIPHLFGLKLDRTGSFLGSLQGIFTHLHETQLIALGLGLLTILIIVVLRKSRPALPGTLIAMRTVGGLVAIFDLNSHGIEVVGAIPRSLPPFHVPNITLYESLTTRSRSVGHRQAGACGSDVHRQSDCRPDPPAAQHQPGVYGVRVGQCVLGVLQRISRQRIVHPFGGEFSRRVRKVP